MPASRIYALVKRRRASAPALLQVAGKQTALAVAKQAALAVAKQAGKQTGKLLKQLVSKKRKRSVSDFPTQISKKMKQQVKQQVKTEMKKAHEKETNTGVYIKHVTAGLDPYESSNVNTAWWSGATREGSNVSPHTTFALSFTPLCHKRLIDAVSVLYNGKTPATNFENTFQNFDYNDLKVTFQKVRNTITFQNNTPVTRVLKIYEFTNKFSTDNSVVTELNNISSAGGWITTPPLFLATAPRYYRLRDAHLHLISGINQKYTWKMKEIRMRPGQIKKLSYVKKDYTVAFANFVSGAGINSHEKGGIQLLIQLDTPQHWGWNTGQQGDAVYQDNSQNEAAGISVTFSEYYRVEQPENTEDIYEGMKKAILVDAPTKEAARVMTRGQISDIVPIG